MTPKKRRGQPEALEQKAYVSWFRMQYPKYAGALMAHIGVKLTGNEFQRANQMREQKAIGYKKGISDIQLAIPNDKYAGLWIEFKAPGKTWCSVSQYQRDHLELMSALGYSAHWVTSFEQAQKITQNYMVTAVSL